MNIQDHINETAERHLNQDLSEFDKMINNHPIIKAMRNQRCVPTIEFKGYKFDLDDIMNKNKPIKPYLFEKLLPAYISELSKAFYEKVSKLDIK